MAARRVEYTRLICPAPMPSVAPPRAKTMALDLTNLHTRQAKRRSASSAAVGWRRVGTLSSLGSRSARSRVCSSSPPVTLRSSSAALALGREVSQPEHAHVGPRGERARRLRGHARRRQHLDELPFDDRGGGGGVEFAVEGDDAAEGRGGVGAVGGLVGSRTEAAVATPQGLACLTMTQAGVGNCRTHSMAVSASAMLLKESSLPCSTCALAIAGAARARVAIEGGALVRVLPVAQVLQLLVAERQGAGEWRARGVRVRAARYAATMVS